MNAVVHRLLSIIVMVLMWDACAVLRADDIVGPSVTELTLEQATELAGVHGDLELVVRDLGDTLGDHLSRAINGVERLGKAGGQAPANGGLRADNSRGCQYTSGCADTGFTEKIATLHEKCLLIGF